MPAVSKEQQKAMCMALAARKGDLKVKDLKGAALEIYKSDMTDEQIEDFTVLKEGFTNIKEYIVEGKTMKSITQKIKEALNEGYNGEWTWDDEADKDGKIEATVKDFHDGGRSESSVTFELTLDHENEEYYYALGTVVDNDDFPGWRKGAEIHVAIPKDSSIWDLEDYVRGAMEDDDPRWPKSMNYA